MLFETGQPPRFFFPRIAVATGELIHSETVSASPYLGTARHLAYRTDDGDLQERGLVLRGVDARGRRLGDLVTFDTDRVMICDEDDD